MDTATMAPTAVKEEVFDLDVEFVASAPVVAELMRNTDDGCGSTGQSACVGC